METAGTNGMGRREFIGAAAAALFAGVAITITGCDEEDKPTTPSDGSKAGDVQEAGGHKHSVTVTKVQLDAGNAVTLTLTGNGHEHTVDLTADQVKGLKAGTAHLTLASSSTNGHTHTVHFM